MAGSKFIGPTQGHPYAYTFKLGNVSPHKVAKIAATPPPDEMKRLAPVTYS
jgi:hypothetical protein